MGKMRKWKTYVTDGIGPTAYRPSLVSCTFTCFHIPIFFTSVRFCAAGIVLSGEKGQWEGRTKGLTGIAKYDVLRVIAPLGRRMLLPVATMVEMSASREIIVSKHTEEAGKKEKKKNTHNKPLSRLQPFPPSVLPLQQLAWL